jgi:sigma-70-like protein
VTPSGAPAQDRLTAPRPASRPAPPPPPTVDSLRVYLEAIGTIPLLTAEQEVELARTIRSGRVAPRVAALALRHLVEANLRLPAASPIRRERSVCRLTSTRSSRPRCASRPILVATSDENRRLRRWPRRSGRFQDASLGDAQPREADAVPRSAGGRGPEALARRHGRGCLRSHPLGIHGMDRPAGRAPPGPRCAPHDRAERAADPGSASANGPLSPRRRPARSWG